MLYSVHVIWFTYYMVYTYLFYIFTANLFFIKNNKLRKM